MSPQLTLVPRRRIAFTYRNYQGEVAQRRAVVIGVEWGSTRWHPAPGWLLRAHCLDQDEMRLFAMADMTEVGPLT